MSLTIRNKKPTGRFRYFELFIFPVINTGTKKNWKNMKTMIAILNTNNFIDQNVLECLLRKLEITDNGRKIDLDKFVGQLELEDSNNTPMWRIGLKTSSVTTGRRILKSIEEDLELQDPLILYAHKMKIKPLKTFPDFPRELRIQLSGTPWYSGYFTEATVLVRQLLNQRDVQESIKEDPGKYKDLHNLLAKT